MIMNYLKKIGLKYWILMFLVSVPIFGYLDTLPIRLWDESRLANNTIEMASNKNWLVTYYDGKPDLWNTKPPLLIWLQTILIKLIGANEISIRLPSAIAALLTCISLFLFSFRYLKNFWLGFISITVLVASQGYIKEHVTRTGDYDSLLTFFTTLISLFAFIYIDSKQKRYIYLFFVACLGAVMTKGIAGLLFFPGIFFFILSQKELLSLLRNKHFYLGLLLFIIPIITYYISREHYLPGYLEAVWKNELGGRFIKINEGHSESFFFYINEIFTKDLLFILSILVIPGVVTGLKRSSNTTKRFFSFLIINIISFILIISISQTKLSWYAAPVYPLLSFCIAKFIEVDFSRLKFYTKNKTSTKIVPYLFLITILLIPYTRSIKRIYKPKEHEWDKKLYETSYYLRNRLQNEDYKQAPISLIYKDSVNPQELFYLNSLAQKQIPLYTKTLDQVKSGETIISSEKWIKDSIQKIFLYTILDTKSNLITFKIYGKRPKNH